MDHAGGDEGNGDGKHRDTAGDHHPAECRVPGVLIWLPRSGRPVSGIAGCGRRGPLIESGTGDV
jgi:hypothetical protein